MSDQEILKYLIEIFPVVGQSEGKALIEMKFKMQVSPEEEKMERLHEIIEQLKEDGILDEWELGGNINYKARKEIPVSLDGGGAPPTAGGDGSSDALSKLVIALAESSDDPAVKEALADYKETL